MLSTYEDREGDLWLGTDSAGLHVLRDQKFTTYTTSDGLSGNFVRCVFESAKGELWIGTDGAGLNRRTSSGFAHYSPQTVCPATSSFRWPTVATAAYGWVRPTD